VTLTIRTPMQDLMPPKVAECGHCHVLWSDWVSILSTEAPNGTNIKCFLDVWSDIHNSSFSMKMRKRACVGAGGDTKVLDLGAKDANRAFGVKVTGSRSPLSFVESRRNMRKHQLVQLDEEMAQLLPQLHMGVQGSRQSGWGRTRGAELSDVAATTTGTESGKDGTTKFNKGTVHDC